MSTVPGYAMGPATRILVVDDEDGLRISIGMILERAGFRVVLATNVPEALEAIGSQFFDVLLSDLRMPGPGDGMTVIHAMRAKHPDAVTLLMSGNLDPETPTLPLAEDEILRKPLQMRAVVSLIHAKLATADWNAGSANLDVT